MPMDSLSPLSNVSMPMDSLSPLSNGFCSSPDFKSPQSFRSCPSPLNYAFLNQTVSRVTVSPWSRSRTSRLNVKNTKNLNFKPRPSPGIERIEEISESESNANSNIESVESESEKVTVQNQQQDRDNRRKDREPVRDSVAVLSDSDSGEESERTATESRSATGGPESDSDSEDINDSDSESNYGSVTVTSIAPTTFTTPITSVTVTPMSPMGPTAPIITDGQIHGIVTNPEILNQLPHPTRYPNTVTPRYDHHDPAPEAAVQPADLNNDFPVDFPPLPDNTHFFFYEPGPNEDEEEFMSINVFLSITLGCLCCVALALGITLGVLKRNAASNHKKSKVASRSSNSIESVNNDESEADTGAKLRSFRRKIQKKSKNKVPEQNKTVLESESGGQNNGTGLTAGGKGPPGSGGTDDRDND